MTLTSDPSVETNQTEGTDVTFTCIVDGNQVPTLSLWLLDENGRVLRASDEIVTDKESTFTVTLTRYHNRKQFFCKATNENPKYVYHSNRIEYTVYCK